ncbi:MAG: hypothetical protein NXI31_24160 [bacterium]|nr:hypothetical protein [bacterium]
MTTMEFEDLMRAHALGALLPHEHARLLALAGDDSGAAADTAHERSARLGELDAVLATFAVERELQASVTAADEPFAASDPTLQQLTRTAARAEQELRARLEHGVPAGAAAIDSSVVADGSPRAGQVTRWRRPVGGLLLAAAAAVALWLLGVFDPAETRLDPRSPDDLRAGDRGAPPLQLVLLQPTLTAESRTISWGAVPGASGYHASILDRSGAIVLERAPELLRSTAWELSAIDYEAVQKHRPLRLRVTALDSMELPIGSSGDLELTLR